MIPPALSKVGQLAVQSVLGKLKGHTEYVQDPEVPDDEGLGKRGRTSINKTSRAQTYLYVPPKEVAQDKDVQLLQDVVEGTLGELGGVYAAVLTVSTLRQRLPQLRVVQGQKLPRVIHHLQ